MTQQVTLSGNVSNDPELTFTSGGRPLCKFGIACERTWGKDDDAGGKKKETSFFNVTVWGQMGENVSASVLKGDRVVVEGRLDQRTYETQAGEKRSVVDVTANDVGLSLLWVTGEPHRRERSKPDVIGRGPDPVYADESDF